MTAHPALGVGLSDRVANVLRTGAMTTREVAEALGVANTPACHRSTLGQIAVSRALTALRRRGLVRVVDHVDEPVGGPKRHVRRQCKRVYGLT